jgi:uncharacterized protein (TIGR04255 family)
VEIKSQQRRHYLHAPITEAVISIGYELPSEVRLEDLLKVHAKLESEYPARAEHFTVEFQVDATERHGKAGAPQVVGYQLVSPDRKRIVRLTLSDLTFSQLGPYDRWEALRTETRRIWTILEAVLQPRRIIRVSVRFINRIDMPDPQASGVDLDIYFHTAPKIPPELPQVMNTYFVRLELPFELPLRAPHGVLILTLTAAQPPSAGVVSAILDLDAIMQNIDMNTTNAWQAIEELRDVKNAAFEASITDAARELFK